MSETDDATHTHEPGTDTHELLDEVLEQSSQQALRMSHLDESVAELKASLAAVRADLAQLGHGVMQQSIALQEDVLKPAARAAPELDAIESNSQSVKSKVALLTALSFVQTLMLGALVVFAVKPMATIEAPPPVTASPAVQAPAEKPVQVAVEKPIEQNPFAGAPGAPGSADADAAKADGNADATKHDAKGDPKAKKKAAKKAK